MLTQPLTPKQQQPYLLGLLCLIPLIGAFVGFGLLLYGIIKYKDKWLIMIGAFGILFTIAVYSLLFYVGWKSNIGKQGFASLSQMQLNSLLKDVEFYKLQNGTYPDSLGELKDYDKFSPINDVLQAFPLRKGNGYYNYERVGEKYILFSSGIDGIPDTKDDFYPQVVIKDSSKIGLIRLK